MASMRSLVFGIALIAMAGCAAQTTAGQNATSSAKCDVDTAKICTDAQSTGTLEVPPPATGYGTPQSMPDTAHLAIPNGPTLQVMCYYNPQHTSVTRSDWTSSNALDDNAIGYLTSKGLCKK